MEDFTREKLEEALRAIVSTISEYKKMQPKLKPDTFQRALLIRRIKALHIAPSLIIRELESIP